MKGDAVKKEDEDSREELEPSSVSRVGKNDWIEDPENVSSNLDDVSADTTTADDIDNAEFQRSTEAVPPPPPPTTTTTTTTTNSIGDLAGIQ